MRSCAGSVSAPLGSIEYFMKICCGEMGAQTLGIMPGGFFYFCLVEGHVRDLGNQSGHNLTIG